ncbi:hypothetical protein ACCD06_17410 [Azospirillum sp. CT11-132]|uniref:hypothetical protein n=1 Tax=Azospirillum sp. CT11-132 TaxID=3396317 RepID=UPI0039A4CA68
MTETKRDLGSDLAKIDRHVIQLSEYDEIPEITGEMFARGTVMKGGNPALSAPDPLT